MKTTSSRRLERTLVAAAILSACAASFAAETAPAEAPTRAPLRAGTYTETTPGLNGMMEVEVKLSENRIESVRVVKSAETPFIADEPMRQVTEQVLARQNLAVDTVAGATRSTASLLRAIGQAIESAGGSSAEWTPDPVIIDPATLPLAETPDADVVVVGAGASGLAAAAAAADAGARVVVLEKAPAVGGSAALSPGLLTAAGSDIQKASGLPADPQGLVKLWLEDQKQSVRGGSRLYPDATRVEGIVAQSAETVSWLTKTVGLQFSANPAAADGIGAYALIPAGVEAGRPAGASQADALAGFVTKKGGKILTGTGAWKLLTNADGSVAGVAAADGTNRFEFRAKAVVLATGGFGADLVKITERQPRWAVYAEQSAAAEGSTGDGLELAAQAGGREVADSWLIGVGIKPAYRPIAENMLGPRGWAGITLVNEKGVRFVREDQPVITDAMSEQRDTWLIVDSADKEKANNLLAYFGYDTVVVGNTFEELARRMGSNASTFAATMKKYNEDAAAGKDTLFGRAAENLTPITAEPFFAVRVRPVIGGTIGGVVTDAGWKVLNSKNAPVPGLWAVGEMANRPFYNRVYEPGTSLLIAYTSGLAAGRAAAAAALK